MLKPSCALVTQVFCLVFNFNSKSIPAAYIHFWGRGREKNSANNIWFQSQVCVKIASSHLWQGYATSREYTAWLKYENISLK